ncbi:MAG: hypothetical protein QNJ22_20330 [Desulfosarcinaceae bacterium]|nr:hypothetical protein [Desulfosarcinaceae bacterium]
MPNSGRMYAAQAYISGKGGNFKNAVLDQIRNGIFLLDIQEEKTYIGKERIAEADSRTIQQDQTLRVYVRKCIGPDGQELRKDAGDNPLKTFGITLIQANVQDVDPDPGFKKKLLEQREAAAPVAIERVIAAESKAKEAKQEQLRRVTLAETLMKESAVEKERKEIELATARIEAQRIEALAEAGANKRRKLMQADNALENGWMFWSRSPKPTPSSSKTNSSFPAWRSPAVRGRASPMPPT